MRYVIFYNNKNIRIRITIGMYVSGCIKLIKTGNFQTMCLSIRRKIRLKISARMRRSRKAWKRKTRDKKSPRCSPAYNLRLKSSESHFWSLFLYKKQLFTSKRKQKAKVYNTVCLGIYCAQYYTHTVPKARPLKNRIKITFMLEISIGQLLHDNWQIVNLHMHIFDCGFVDFQPF